MPGRPFTVPRPFTVRAALREMSDVAMELLSVTLTRAPLGLKLDAYGFLAAVLDTAEDATRRVLRPCDELIGINGTLYDDIPTESTPDAAAELCDLVGEYLCGHQPVRRVHPTILH